MFHALIRFIQQHLRLITLCSFLFGMLPFPGAGQTNTAILHDTLTNTYLPLQNYKWRFHPGDDTAWASPNVSDANWKNASIKFGKHDLPEQWTGIGWFRIWLKKEEAARINAWALQINHDGASEIYLDGQKIAAIGKVGPSKQTYKAARDPFLAIPLAITDTMPHLLAIRYCNYDHYFSNFVGFQGWISEANFMLAKHRSDQRFYDYLLMSGAAMSMLILLHLLLYAFYPKQKVNLYYSLFVLGTTISLFARYEAIVTRDPGMQLLLYKIFSASISLMPFFFALLLYHVSSAVLPRKKLWFIGIISMVFTVIYFFGNNVDLLTINSTIGTLNNLFTVLVMADGLIAVSKAIRRGDQRIWLIGFGILIVVLGSVIVGANTFRLFNFYQLMTGMAILCLVMPVLFSIYIAMDVASTNRQLSAQLKQNDLLASENLLKEQEKTQLITQQAEQLEKTVMERTAQVRDQAERLREMDAAKSRFFVNLTHEFKTPLTLIINPARELLKQPDTAAAKQYASFILQNSERLLQLINQLLDLSRLENGQMDIHYQSIDLVKWLQLHVQQFSSLAEHHQLRLNLSNNIQELPVRADLDKLEKITQNIISNAIKFSQPDSSIEITLIKTNDAFFTITVSDQGTGIPADKLPYIFDRFYQADASDTRTREGTGIGLALVKELTELLGGSISVSSKEAGTTFSIQLPYHPADLDPSTENLAASPAAVHSLTRPAILPSSGSTEHPVQHNETILIVEDNEQLREFMNISLRENYQILLAQNGEEGIIMATEQIPTLILTDLMMPHKNGYELCEVLKKDERTSHIPVIMLTAKTDQDSRIHGLETGADAYLSKPFDKRELIAQITNLIQLRKQLREKYSRNNNWLTHTTDLPSIEQHFLERIRTAINDRLDDLQFNAEELGREVGLSRTQLYRKLKDLIDQSPGDLIRGIRMQKAHELLEKNAGTVSEICYLVGYGNPANFSTSFTKHFGYPPSGVRK
ncbi:ATP-binding protein [Terrimonas sp. NA20]|uniref:histidine kinase n=1 Tax=Terrimonas ginsenosidimutans TaxID=2908004 RepID=A0ABS9KK99_9BACT|nr:ATP-binding protein [Terrimonas ginsenosidimutans]MCG2612752.1 ATP-binding protein [Terrimonas ginsenosidimutans]